MPKVLIIEDEPLIARMYQKALGFDHFEVVSANGGSEGLQKVKSEKPDIVLCDVMMPEPNGMQVLEAIKADPETQNIPVIMLTNLSGKHDADLAIQKGAQDFWVKKDTDHRQLGAKLKAILEKQAPPSSQTS